ncbi:MAG TPA: sulfurtransferase, partial [Roseiflexaceae bacterium]|nr:sulfurtransferase [Roseiflexaceae bacterium]
MTPPLVTATWLAEHAGDPVLRIIDTRWYLLEPERGHAEYHAGHIPGAVYLNIDGDLAAPVGSGPGRHPLPSAEQFAEVCRRAGINADTHVIAYDIPNGMAATRPWWLLRYYGHQHVSLLDGGWQAWLAAGLPVTDAVITPPPGSFIPQPQAGMIVDASDVEALRHDPQMLLLDARAAERYAGYVEPIDRRAGHIPGAVSAPYAGNLAEDGRMRSAEDLAARYRALGAADARQIVCYCGSGVSATHTIFALQLAGYTALLYPGSWSDWSSDP